MDIGQDSLSRIIGDPWLWWSHGRGEEIGSEVLRKD